MITLFTAGPEWIYALIAHEIAMKHNPYLVLKLLKHSGKCTVIAIAAIMIAFGAGMAVMRFIQKYASEKEIHEAASLVKAVEGRQQNVQDYL